MTTDSAVASLQADLTALRAENKELTERLNQLEAAAEASAPPSVETASRHEASRSPRCSASPSFCRARWQLPWLYVSTKVMKAPAQAAEHGPGGGHGPRSVPSGQQVASITAESSASASASHGATSCSRRSPNREP